MAQKTNRTCVICGKKYYYCPDCSEFQNAPRWMAGWCSDRCHDTYDVLVDYGTKKLDVNTAYKRIKAFDWSDIDSWENPVTKRDIKEILNYVHERPEKTATIEAENKNKKGTKKL